MGVRLSLPAPSILFIFSSLFEPFLAVSAISGTNLGTVHILFTFNQLKILTLPLPSNLIY